MSQNFFSCIFQLHNSVVYSFSMILLFIPIPYFLNGFISVLHRSVHTTCNGAQTVTGLQFQKSIHSQLSTESHCVWLSAFLVENEADSQSLFPEYGWKVVQFFLKWQLWSVVFFFKPETPQGFVNSLLFDFTLPLTIKTWETLQETMPHLSKDESIV